MRKLLVLGFLALAIVGCGKKGSEQENIVGNWLLVKLNGADQIEANSYFEIYDSSLSYSQVNIRPRVTAVTGTYTIQNAVLTQNQSTGAVLTYSVELSSGRLVARSSRGAVYEYRKVSDAEREAIFARN